LTPITEQQNHSYKRGSCDSTQKRAVVCLTWKAVALRS